MFAPFACGPTPRHPELVSGSIGPSWPERWTVNRECRPHPNPPVEAEEWILKQVQDDGRWVAGHGESASLA